MNEIPWIRESLLQPISTCRGDNMSRFLGSARVAELSEPTAMNVDASEAAANSYSRSCCTVLLAEDDESIRVLLSARLREAGFAVIAVDSGEKAIRQITRAGRLAHVVVTDGVMSGIDGFEVARFFSLLNPPVPVILITGFIEYFASRNDRPENMVSILEKPVSGDTLTTTIERARD